MFKQPSFLKKNDTVALIATAKNFDQNEIKIAISILQKWDLNVLEGPNVYKKFNQFAGTDKERQEDLQWALDETSIKAIFCVRGGYGTSRIIDKIDFKKFSKNPKWVIGFSDVTTLHSAIQYHKIQSIHGVMPIHFGEKKYTSSIEKLKSTLFGKLLGYKIPSYSLNKQGNAQGILVGGNLSIINSLIRTEYELKLKNKILFMEDVGENLYRLDRIMVQLKQAGFLKNISGLIVGHFTAMEDNKIKFGKSSYEIIADAVKEYDYPVCYGFPAGHEPDNMPLIFGADTLLSILKNEVRIKFK